MQISGCTAKLHIYLFIRRYAVHKFMRIYVNLWGSQNQVNLYRMHFLIKKNGTITVVCKIKPLQNKKGQKNLGYPTRKQSFFFIKALLFYRVPQIFFVPSCFEVALVQKISFHEVKYKSLIQSWSAFFYWKFL